MYTIAIQPDNIILRSGRRQSFSSRWIDQLQNQGHEVKIVDVLEGNFFKQLDGCNAFMWWFAHIPFPKNFGKRLVSTLAHSVGLPVFPSWETIWHFDDKVAQYYLLKSSGFPIPNTFVFWHRNKALEYCQKAKYPLVLKLASGITSENVELIKNFDEAKYWIECMFSGGVVSLLRESLLSPQVTYRRLRHSAFFFLKGHTPELSRRTEVQKDYFLIQEFLVNNDYDTRITIIGNKAFGFRRFNRKNDFRASGSGMIDWDPSKIDQSKVRLAFNVSMRLRTQSIAIDILTKGTELVITEISYYYEGWALYECPGHWELHGDSSNGDLRWVDYQMHPEDAILEKFLQTIETFEYSK